MADRIITVTDPSVVTNDTLAGYNNYSDIDGQLGATMTPTEATNGHTVTLSDGATHQVTTKPVGTSNGEFSAVVSNAVEVNTAASSILFQDDFTGTTIDTNKWTIVNPGSVNVVPSQNDKSIWTGSGVENTSQISDYQESKVLPSIATYPEVYYQVDFQSNAANQASNGMSVYIPIDGSFDNAVLMDMGASSTSHMNVTIRDGAASILASEYNVGNFVVWRKVKVKISATEVQVWNWTGVWTLLLTQAVTWSGASSFRLCGRSLVTASTLSEFDNAYISESAYSTEFPT